MVALPRPLTWTIFMIFIVFLSAVYLFNKYLLNICYLLGKALDTKDRKTRKRGHLAL
jgi:hypothetical protein